MAIFRRLDIRINNISSNFSRSSELSISSFHGAFSSTYLLISLAYSKASSRDHFKSWESISMIYSLTLLIHTFHTFHIFHSNFHHIFNANAIARFRRFPRLLDNFALKVRIACSWEKSPSSPIGKAVKRYNMSISLEYSEQYSTGSNTFQIDLDIFWPSTVKNPVVRSCFGAS